MTILEEQQKLRRRNPSPPRLWLLIVTPGHRVNVTCAPSDRPEIFSLWPGTGRFIGRCEASGSSLPSLFTPTFRPAMACEMIYIVQPFSVGDAGELVAEMPIPARSEPEARDQARWMAARYPGVVAFACSGDFDRGEYSGSRILAKHGAIPPEVA